MHVRGKAGKRASVEGGNVGIVAGFDGGGHVVLFAFHCFGKLGRRKSLVTVRYGIRLGSEIDGGTVRVGVQSMEV